MDVVEFPFQHPAAKEANRLFRTLEVYSEDDYVKLPDVIGTSGTSAGLKPKP
jgi:hypothetical protein